MVSSAPCLAVELEMQQRPKCSCDVDVFVFALEADTISHIRGDVSTIDREPGIVRAIVFSD